MNHQIKNFLFIGLFFLLSNSIVAQKAKTEFPLTVGYFSFLGFQPGAKIGMHFDWKKWGKEQDKGPLQNSFFIRPQIGFYTHPNIHTSYLVNTDFGYQRRKSHKGKYTAWSIGLAYLNQSQITSWRVSLANGEKEKVRENWNWFLPTVNYEFGKAINKKIIGYAKCSYGLKMAPTRAPISVFFIELGGHFKLF